MELDLAGPSFHSRLNMSDPVTREEEGSVKVARPEGVPIADVGVAMGATVEVLWDVELDDGSSDSVWWAAKVGEPTEEEAGAARLVYVADHGFEEETRRVLFLDDNHLWDTGLKEALPYRREGEKGPDLEPEGENEEGAAEGEEGEEGADDDGGEGGAFRVGTTVKSRFQGGRYCAGTIAAANADGTYDVLYEDHVLEQSVPSDCIETVSLAPSVRAALADGGTVAAESVSDFFEIFVNSLTSGPYAQAALTRATRPAHPAPRASPSPEPPASHHRLSSLTHRAFARLTPDRKLIASEKVRLRGRAREGWVRGGMCQRRDGSDEGWVRTSCQARTKAARSGRRCESLDASG